MKKEVLLRILLDTEKDEFGINLDTKGFNENTPIQNSLIIASILKVAHNQELERFSTRSNK